MGVKDVHELVLTYNDLGVQEAFASEGVTSLTVGVWFEVLFDYWVPAKSQETSVSSIGWEKTWALAAGLEREAGELGDVG